MAGRDKTQKIRTLVASLSDEPLPFSLQSRIVNLLEERMKTLASPSQQHEAENVSPSFAVQQFRLSDGSLRYYARAGWKSGKRRNSKLIYGLGAWIAPSPTLHILAVESKVGFEYLPQLVNVIDLGEGKNGIIVTEHHEDGGALRLLEYRDDLDLSHMRTLQSLSADE
jgi:hypothetical protein